MNSENISNEKLTEDFDVNDQTPSVDDFIKELEEKERSLQISADMVIEFDDAEIDDEIDRAFLESGLSRDRSDREKSSETGSDDSSSNEKSNAENFSSGGNSSKAAAESSAGQTRADAEAREKADLEKYLDLEKQISELRAERDELRETLSRRQTDFENYRNRTERERGETFKSILSSLAAEILPVIDNLNRALDSVKKAENKNSDDESPENKNSENENSENENSDKEKSANENSENKNHEKFMEGIVLVIQQLNEVFAGMGVQPIPAVGEPFDPNFHEAVASEHSEDVPPGMVLEEMLRGYRIDNRVIRPSLVKVSAAK